MKSLGEKLFDAMLGVAGETELWAGIGAKERAQTERIALAFCAALSHDETATATIEALKAERDSLLAALNLVRMSMGWQYLSDESRAVIDAALTTKDG